MVMDMFYTHTDEEGSDWFLLRSRNTLIGHHNRAKVRGKNRRKHDFSEPQSLEYISLHTLRALRVSA